MLLGHHAVPLAASHLMIVIVADEGIALEEALAFISTYIRLRIALLIEGMVLCLEMWIRDRFWVVYIHSFLVFMFLTLLI